MILHCVLALILTIVCIILEVLGLCHVHLLSNEMLKILEKVNSVVILVLILRSLIDQKKKLTKVKAFMADRLEAAQDIDRDEISSEGHGYASYEKDR